MNVSFGVQQDVVTPMMDMPIEISEGDISVNKEGSCEGEGMHPAVVPQGKSHTNGVFSSTGRNQSIKRTIVASEIIEKRFKFSATGGPIYRLVSLPVVRSVTDAKAVEASTWTLIRNYTISAELDLAG